MAIFKSFNDVVISLIEYLRLVQPELDTKPGTVSRDVFVDAPAQQIANLYSQLLAISELQSLLAASGTDLSKLASNFGVTRVNGASSSGTIVFTTNNMDVDILIPEGSVVTSRNGVNFETQTSVSMKSENANVYRANATRMRTDLDLAAITDEFALEVSVQALTSGLSGNIGKFAIISHNISGISNVTNLSSFSGGSDAESDDQFRTRILSIFAGSNTGTALGYLTAIGIVPGVLDSEIVVPGDPLLIRDGTQVSTNSSGELIVSEPGSGGKVDIYVLGSSIDSQVDSFIYNDKSGRNDPVDPINDYILGQKGQDTSLNTAQRRVALIAANDLPNQPVDNIVGVAGSSSGANFIEAYTDENGRQRGNFELVKDTGDFGGSPFGFDKIHWTSDTIELDNEDVTKGIFNGNDSLNFSDIVEIRNISQSLLITNENSTISTSNRSYITLKHTPVTNVSRIVNLTTGERYIVSNQNPDGIEGEPNTTGRIIISGSTLPIGTDILQVDYTWSKSFDSIFDFDNLKDYNVVRSVQDSVDWSFGNLVFQEPATVSEDIYGVLTVTVSHPISKVISVDILNTEVSSVTNGAITVGSTVSNVLDVRRSGDNAELFNTDSHSGTLSGTATIILPSDSIAEDGDISTVRFNSSDIFSPFGYDPGTFSSNIITLPDTITIGGTTVIVNYIANVRTLLSEQELSYLPAVKNKNKFLINGTLTGEQPTSYLLDGNDNVTNSLRRASSNIRIDVNSIPSPGAITISGTTIKKVTDALVVVTAGSGYGVDLQSAIKDDMGVTTLSSNIRVVKLADFERVNVNSSNLVESVDNIYDIVNYGLYDNTYDLNVALQNTSLNKTTVSLPQTLNNVDAILNTGDVVRVTFYYINISDYEQLYFSKNGVQITNKVFSSIDRVSLASGFKNGSGQVKGNFTISNFNQPDNNTTYGVGYDYIGPKENERITVTFNQNSIANTATVAIERVRPITADVIVKMAKAKTIDVTARIVLLPTYINQESTVKQDAADAVSSFLNSNSLGTTVDASDVINTLYSVSGIDRVRIINFSIGDSGNLLSVTANKNEYLDAGTVTIVVEER